MHSYLLLLLLLLEECLAENQKAKRCPGCILVHFGLSCSAQQSIFLLNKKLTKTVPGGECR
jgi:hypothetical protein